MPGTEGGKSTSNLIIAIPYVLISLIAKTNTASNGATFDRADLVGG